MKPMSTRCPSLGISGILPVEENLCDFQWMHHCTMACLFSKCSNFPEYIGLYRRLGEFFRRYWPLLSFERVHLQPIWPCNHDNPPSRIEVTCISINAPLHCGFPEVNTFLSRVTLRLVLVRWPYRWSWESKQRTYQSSTPTRGWRSVGEVIEDGNIKYPNLVNYFGRTVFH